MSEYSPTELNAEDVDFEICPVCSKRTASHLFRTVSQARCCFFCAQKAEKQQQDQEAIKLDRRYHGGHGWIWKHALKVAACTIVLLILRMALIHFLLTQGQQ